MSRSRISARQVPEPLKIAIVQQPISVLPVPALCGSLEIWIYEVARRLAKSCQVTVFSKKDRDQPKVEVSEGVCYRRIGTRIDNRIMGLPAKVPKLRRLPLFKNTKRPLFASGVAYSEYGLKVASEIRKRGFDVVHLLNFSQMVIPMRAFNPAVKIALHMECEWLSQLDRQMIERRVRKCDLVIGCSDYITERIRTAFPQFAGRCRTVYNGVDVSRFAPADARADQKAGQGLKRLLFVGRIWPDKGAHILLEAFKRVAEYHPDARLELIGWKQGPPAEYVLNLSQDEQVQRLAPLYNADFPSYLLSLLSPEIGTRVSFEQPLAHPELAERYRKAGVLIFPSVWNEPFGIPLIEAMATGIPIIATRGGAFPEIVEHGKTGLLVPRGDAPALAEAILRLLDNEELRRSMGAAGREQAVERFSWERITEDLLSEYGRIMSLGTQSRLASKQVLRDETAASHASGSA